MQTKVVRDADRDDRCSVGNLRVKSVLFRFVEDELLPAIDQDSVAFWRGFEALIDDLTPVNRNLLQFRDELQRKIDAWHGARHGAPWDHGEYVDFLKGIGYLKEIGESFQITTAGVDPEIATIAGPQLVVPVNNARFALNAANARWGSLYDALYGSDVIAETDGQQRGSSYNPQRGAAVIRYATEFLDRAVPLDTDSHGDVVQYSLDLAASRATFLAMLKDGETGRSDGHPLP